MRNTTMRLATTASTALLIGALLTACGSTPETYVAETTDTPDAEAPAAALGSYAVVDTMQSATYDDLDEIDPPSAGEPFYGQDAQNEGNPAAYTDNGDGTVTDEVTGLMWTRSPDLDGDGVIDASDKLSYDEAVASAEGVDVAGYDDWRLPTIKELYSLIDFRGIDPSGYQGTDTSALTPFVDTEYFDFAYGDTSSGERIIDAQMASSTTYVDTTMGGDHTMFGVNFADGRIKGYGTGPTPGSSEDKGFYVYYVRDGSSYGVNDFVDNADGTVTDGATGLMWEQDDSGMGMDWEAALAWAEQANAEEHLGYGDWRLPDAKELQSIVDYSRAPGVSDSAAIDPVFESTQITNEAGESDYPWYWSSTTHISMAAGRSGGAAAYLSFGTSPGYMRGAWLDVHGAGSQRSDPKSGDASEFPTGRGPQGDAIRIDNHVRLVRDAE